MNSSEFERWQPPPELMRASPREVRLTGGGLALAGLALALLAGAVFAVVGLSLHSARATEAARRLEREGVETEAEIVALGRPTGKDRQRVATYQYIAGGQPHSARVRLRREAWRHLEVGSRIPVRYLESDPAVSYLRGREPKPTPPLAIAGAALGLALGAVFIVWAIRRERSLILEGRPALARVTETKRTSRGQHGHGYRVQYEFRTLSGAMRKGSYETGKNPPGPGETFTILCARDNPGHSARYPLKLWRVSSRA